MINVDFMCLLDIPTSEDRKREAYRQKIAECIDRAEKLKDLIDQQKGTVEFILFHSNFNEHS
jgi:queuine/archaeosine tRNA-ribosyltransferase